MSIIKAIQENTAAREELTEAMRAIDGNGHVPDDDELASGPCACCLREDPAYQLGYREALDMIAGLAGEAQASMEKVIALLTEGPEA